MVRMSATEGMEVIGIGSVLVELLAVSVRAYEGFLVNVTWPDLIGWGCFYPPLLFFPVFVPVIPASGPEVPCDREVNRA